MARRRRLAVCLVALSWLGGALALDAYGRRETARGRYDAIVVLGCKVYANGEAGLTLTRRTRHAVRLWQEGLAPRIVLTGGVGDHGPSEAEAAARVAERMGVPREALVLEDRSTSTEENMRYTAELVGRDARVLLVTDAYHVFRSERVARRYFERVRGVGSTGDPWPRLKGSLREVGAVVIYGALGRVG